MKAITAALVIFLEAFPVVALAAPPPGEFYLYWSEPDSHAYISLESSSYEISGRFVAVLTFEEKPLVGNHVLIGELYDCFELQCALFEKVEFDIDNRVVSSYSNENIRKSFEQIEEDTRQEFILIGVCDEEKGKPYDVGTVRKYFKLIAESLEDSEGMVMNR